MTTALFDRLTYHCHIVETGKAAIASKVAQRIQKESSLRKADR